MVGVFDSGVGGLTVVRAIQCRLPNLSLLYVGDSANAPYGPRPDAEIQSLSLGITGWLVAQGCEAVVVACNTATTASIGLLRQRFPHVSFVGVEPAIKPAAAQTRSGTLAVLATAATLQSPRFATLVARHAPDKRVLTDPCSGWVEAIEAGEAGGMAPRVRAVVEPLVAAGADTLVLGCTHFPVLQPLLAEVLGPEIVLLETGPAVAERLASLQPPHGTGQLRLYTTGDPQRFAQSAAVILGSDRLAVDALYWSHGELTNHAKSGWSGEP